MNKFKKYIGICLSGRKFNLIFQDYLFVKLTNKKENHNGFQFIDGLNVDTAEKRNGSCQPGYIYFCRYESIFNWLDYQKSMMVYFRYVSLPDDAQVFCEEDKFKTDKIILSPRILISDLNIWNDKEQYLSKLRAFPRLLKYIKNCPSSILIELLTKDGTLIKYLDSPNEDLCWTALMESPHALKYIKCQTEPMSMFAVQKDGKNLRFVLNQTEKIQILALEQSPFAIQYVKNPSSSMCFSAVDRYPRLIHYVKSPSEKLCFFAIKKEPECVNLIQNPTLVLCKYAYSLNKDVSKYFSHEIKSLMSLFE